MKQEVTYAYLDVCLKYNCDCLMSSNGKPLCSVDGALAYTIPIPLCINKDYAEISDKCPYLLEHTMFGEENKC